MPAWRHGMRSEGLVRSPQRMHYIVHLFRASPTPRRCSGRPSRHSRLRASGPASCRKESSNQGLPAEAHWCRERRRSLASPKLAGASSEGGTSAVHPLLTLAQEGEMSQSPFGRVLSKRELEHRRRMLAHLTSASTTATAEAAPFPRGHDGVAAAKRRTECCCVAVGLFRSSRG